MRSLITVRRFVAGALVLGGLLLAGCGSTSGEVTTTSTASQPVEPAPVATDVVVIPGAEGTFPDETLVQCGGPPLFSAGVLKNPVLLADSTLVDDRSFAALGEFLGSEEGDFWPQDGYWVLSNTDQSLLLAHIGTNGEVTLIGSEFDGAAWSPSVLQSGGPCPIQVPLPAGVHEVRWRIDPANPPESTSTSISLLATGEACSGGQPMGDRLQPPQVLITNTTVYLVLAATNPLGAQDCPGNPEESMIVELGEPLGSRPIVDARTAAGVLSDYLPASPCGQIDPALIAAAEERGEPFIANGLGDRTSC